MSTFDFTRELAGIRMGERPGLAGVRELQWPPVAARPALSTPGQVNVIPHHPCVVAFLLNRRQSNPIRWRFMLAIGRQGGPRDMIFNNGACCTASHDETFTESFLQESEHKRDSSWRKVPGDCAGDQDFLVAVQVGPVELSSRRNVLSSDVCDTSCRRFLYDNVAYLGVVLYASDIVVRKVILLCVT